MQEFTRGRKKKPGKRLVFPTQRVKGLPVRRVTLNGFYMEIPSQIQRRKLRCLSLDLHRIAYEIKELTQSKKKKNKENEKKKLFFGCFPCISILSQME